MAKETMKKNVKNDQALNILRDLFMGYLLLV